MHTCPLRSPAAPHPPKPVPSPPAPRARTLLARAARDFFDTPRMILVAAVGLFALEAALSSAATLRPSAPRHVVLVVVAVAALRAVVRGWLRPGILRALDEVRRERDASLDTLTGATDVFVETLACNLLSSALSLGSLVVGALPGLGLALWGATHGSGDRVLVGLVAMGVLGMALYLYAWLGVRFAELAIALDGARPVAALDASWRLARGRRLLLLRVTLASVACEVGALELGAGAFVGLPLVRVVADRALVDLYAELRRTEPRASSSPHRPSAPLPLRAAA